MEVSLQASLFLLLLWTLILRIICAQNMYRTNASDCNATLYGPIINGEESTNHIEVLMGNETSPIELICQVAISNSNRYPTIALVIPEIINSFEELRGGVRNDDLYQDINYTRPDSHPQTNSDIMRYSFQIYPKIKMNRTMLRCGVTLLQRNGEICWGEQVVLIKYVNSSLVSSNTDGRSCSEKIVGPLCDDNSTQPIQFREADENNTLTLRCRVICQEDGAYYTPYIRLITSEGDKIYDLGSNSSPSNDSNSSPSNDTCDTENHIQDYEFHLAALNETLNGSIAMCGVFYQSRFENFTENCSTSTVVWITLKPPPPMAVTIPPTNSSKVEAETGSSAEQYCIPKIPEGVAIVFIVLAIILCLVVTGLALIGAIYVYKKFCKKNSVHAETDKSTVKENDSAIKCQAQGH